MKPSIIALVGILVIAGCSTESTKAPPSQSPVVIAPMAPAPAQGTKP